MIIGRASAAEADYFEGDILGVKVFNQEAPVTTIRDAFAPETLAAHAPQAPSESRRTDDGRLCLSPCSLQGPLWAAAAAAAAAAKPTKPAVSLSCTDSLRRADFNGHIGQKFLAICPPDCLHANAPLEGCNLFTAGSSICKASLHSGAVPKEGGEVLLTVTEGLEFYDASQGHFGKQSFIGLQGIDVTCKHAFYSAPSRYPQYTEHRTGAAVVLCGGCSSFQDSFVRHKCNF